MGLRTIDYRLKALLLGVGLAMALGLAHLGVWAFGSVTLPGFVIVAAGGWVRFCWWLLRRR